MFVMYVTQFLSATATATALIRFPWDSSDSHGTKCEEILKVQILVDLKEPRFRCHIIFIFLKCSYFWKLLSNVPALHTKIQQFKVTLLTLELNLCDSFLFDETQQSGSLLPLLYFWNMVNMIWIFLTTYLCKCSI